MEDIILKILLGWNIGVILGLLIFISATIIYLIWFNWWDIVEFFEERMK